MGKYREALKVVASARHKLTAGKQTLTTVRWPSALRLRKSSQLALTSIQAASVERAIAMPARSKIAPWRYRAGGPSAWSQAHAPAATRQ